MRLMTNSNPTSQPITNTEMDGSSMYMEREPSSAVYVLENAGAAKGCVDVAVLGDAPDNVEAAEVAELVASCRLFLELGRTGQGSVGYYTADSVELQEAMAMVAHKPHHILTILKRFDDLITAALTPCREWESGAGLRLNAYLDPGKLPPHRHGPGGLAAMVGGGGNGHGRRAALLHLYTVQLCCSIADHDDRDFVLRRTQGGYGTLVVGLPPGLSVHAAGDVGTGRVRLPIADGGGYLLHGQWIRGLPDPGHSISFLRQVIFLCLMPFYLPRVFVFISTSTTNNKPNLPS